jgi:hypothetical protein
MKVIVVEKKAGIRMGTNSNETRVNNTNLKKFVGCTLKDNLRTAFIETTQCEVRFQQDGQAF